LTASRARIFDLTLISALAAAALFYRLGDLPVYLWDESRLANNAVEMLGGSGWLVTTYDWKPDLWNTKPPLLIWLIAASMSLLGKTEFALRLPSALAAYFTAVIVYWFTARVSQWRWAGIGAAVVLLATAQFVAPHVARTGDYDSILVLATTASAFTCFTMIEDVRASGRVPLQCLVLFVVATSCAVMIKGVAGLLILPGFVIYAALRQTMPAFFATRRTWYGLAAIIGIPAAYYLVREWAVPGYLASVYKNELGGRFAGTIEGHAESPTYYIEILLRFARPWSWIAPLAAVMGSISWRRSHRACTAFLTVVTLSFLAVISVAQTKLSWYVAPTYPLIATLVAIGGCSAWERLQAAIPGPQWWMISRCIIMAIVVLLAGTLAAVIRRNLIEISFAPNRFDLQAGIFIREAIPKTGPSDSVRILADGSDPGKHYFPQEQFYAKRMRLEGRDVSVVASSYHAKPGEWLIWCANHVLKSPVVSGRIYAQQGPCQLLQADKSATP